MRFAVISHGPSLLALDKARNHDVLLETVAFYSILGNTCKGTALKRLQGAMIRLCDQSIDRWMLSVPFPLPRPKAGGVLPMSLRPCWSRACQGKRGGTLVGGGHTHVGQRTLASFPGSFGWWLHFLVASNSRLCVAVSFSRKGLWLQKFTRFYLTSQIFLSPVFLSQFWLIEMRNSTSIKKGTQIDVHIYREGWCHISFSQETKLRSRFNTTDKFVQVKPQ